MDSQRQKKVSTLIKKEIGKINIVNVRVRWCRTQTYYDRAKWRGTILMMAEF